MDKDALDKMIEMLRAYKAPKAYSFVYRVPDESRPTGYMTDVIPVRSETQPLILEIVDRIAKGAGEWSVVELPSPHKFEIKIEPLTFNEPIYRVPGFLSKPAPIAPSLIETETHNLIGDILHDLMPHEAPAELTDAERAEGDA